MIGDICFPQIGKKIATKICYTSVIKILFLFVLAELVTKLYEAAVKKVPNSEEYHSHLFMAYARVGEYKKMQQVTW